MKWRLLCIWAAMLLCGGCADPAPDDPNALLPFEPPDAEPLSEKSGCSPGAYENLFGVNVWATDPVYLDDMTALKARWIRVELRLSEGRDVNYYRGIINQAHGRGLKVLLLVGYEMTVGTPGWRGNDAAWDAYRGRFNADLTVAADTLGALVDAWEVWNEPDHQLDGNYDPGVPARQFGLLLRDAASILRPRSNGALVIGGMATKRFDYLRTARDAAGNLDYDGLGVHTYGPPDWSMRTVRSELDRVYRGWHTAGGLPLWVTEAGGVATPEAEQHASDYLFTLYTHTWNQHRDRVKHIFYFSWHDAVGFGHERFGLVRLNDNVRKPGFQRFADLAPAMAGGACAGPGRPVDNNAPPPPAPPPENLPPELALCVAPSDASCRSNSLTVLRRQHVPNAPDCFVGDGTCVQVGYQSCGLDTCGWWLCEQGAWVCADAQGCDEVARRGACENDPPGPPPPQPMQPPPQPEPVMPEPDVAPPPEPMPQPEECACQAGVNNFCGMGLNVPGCPMTFPGGYCDPNGDGDYADADWVRGWEEYRDACENQPPPPPPPEPEPEPEGEPEPAPQPEPEPPVGGCDGRPDVHISQVWWTPAQPQPGQAVQFHARVHNRCANTGAQVGVGFFVNGQYVGYGVHGAMFADQTVELGMEQRWTTQAGEFTVRAVADDINRFEESDEGNNAAENQLVVGAPPPPMNDCNGRPDATIARVWWSPVEPSAGDAVRFHAQVVNRCPHATAGDVGVAFFVNGEYVGFDVHGPLGPDGQDELVIQEPWQAVEGRFTIRAVVDDIDRFPEADEGNNSAEVDLVVGQGAPPPQMGCGAVIDMARYIVSNNPNIRVLNRLRAPDGNTYDETFAYRDGGMSHGLERTFFVKNPDGSNWEEFGFDNDFVYRYRDASWANTCDQGGDAYYHVRDMDRDAFARWAPRQMRVCDNWASPVQSVVDAGYKRFNGCDYSCTSRYEGVITQRQHLTAHHAVYTTIWGLEVPDVIEMALVDGNGNPIGDRFFYARDLGLVGFEGPAGNDVGRFVSGAYEIVRNANGPPEWQSLCGE